MYSCTWLKPDDPVTYPGIKTLLAEEREARADDESKPVAQVEEETERERFDRLYAICETLLLDGATTGTGNPSWTCF